VSEDVGLEKFPNIKVERGFVIIESETLLTGESWVSAIGDVVAIPGRLHPQLAHLAFVEGEFVADRLAGKKPESVNYDLVPAPPTPSRRSPPSGSPRKRPRSGGTRSRSGPSPSPRTARPASSTCPRAW